MKFKDSKIYGFLKWYGFELVLFITVFSSLLISISAYTKASKNEKNILALQEEVTMLVKKQTAYQLTIKNKLESMDAHITVIEKYAAANYNFFYGDGVKQKLKNSK